MPAEVLFYDDFDATPFSWKVTAGTGVVSKTTTDAEVYRGAASLKLTTSTVAAEACEVHRYIGRPPVTDYPIIVFGGRFAIMDEAISNIAFYNGYRDGTTWFRGKMLHVYSTNLWQWDAGGSGGASLTTVLTRDASEVSTRGVWHTFAIAVNYATTKHEEMLIDDTYFNVTGQALRQAADAATPNLLDFAIETTNLGGSPGAGVILFDNMYAVGLTDTDPGKRAVVAAQQAVR